MQSPRDSAQPPARRPRGRASASPGPARRRQRAAAPPLSNRRGRERGARDARKGEVGETRMGGGREMGEEGARRREEKY
eukprot:6515175-Pyramimonas_sp.AAC.2